MSFELRCHLVGKGEEDSGGCEGWNGGGGKVNVVGGEGRREKGKSKEPFSPPDVMSFDREEGGRRVYI